VFGVHWTLAKGGVGKSTVIKQVVRSFGDGESALQLELAIIHVRKQLVQFTIGVCNEILADIDNDNPSNNGKEKSQEFEGEPSEGFFEFVEELQCISNRGLRESEHPELAKCLQGIWEEPHFIAKHSKFSTSEMNTELHLKLNSVKMFLGRIGELFQSTFKLTSDEYLHIRQPTTGMQKSIGKIKNKTFEVLDVGGQVHFQDEWPALIKTTKAEGKSLGILFIISLVDYGLSEDGTQSAGAWDYKGITDKNVTSSRRISSAQTVALSNSAASEHPGSYSNFSTDKSQCNMDTAIETWSDNINGDPLTKPSKGKNGKREMKRRLNTKTVVFEQYERNSNVHTSKAYMQNSPN